MKAIKFHPEADIEMIDSALFYETQQNNLGKRFLSNIQDSLKNIQINPCLYPIIYLDIRRCITKTFPFNVLFRINSENIVIVAIMHHSKNPNYWKYRSQ